MVTILFLTDMLFNGVAIGADALVALLAAPGDGIASKVNEIVETLKSVGRPVAILGIVLLALSWLAAGVLPEWAQQNRGVLVKMLMGGILLGIAPDVVALVLP